MQYKVFSPDRLILSEQADMAVFPGEEGEFAILPRHAIRLAQLKAGHITFYRSGKPCYKFSVEGGFVSVQPDLCKIFADEIQEIPIESSA